jgi:Zn-dependent protease
MHMLAGVVLTLVPMILSLTVHEFAHALAGKLLGDTTAEEMGRLTLNPIPHIDPIGTLLLPAVLTYSGLPGFGWAKPVRYDPRRFTRKISMRTGALLVSAAGPFSNLVMAIAAVSTVAVLAHAGVISRAPEAVVVLLDRMVQLNIALFVFNMIPVGPLDGKAVFGGLLRGNAAVTFDNFNARFGRIGLVLLFVYGGRLISQPVIYIYNGLWTAFGLG